MIDATATAALLGLSVRADSMIVKWFEVRDDGDYPVRA